jgi:hypothetical protein
VAIRATQIIIDVIVWQRMPQRRMLDLVTVPLHT